MSRFLPFAIGLLLAGCETDLDSAAPPDVPPQAQVVTNQVTLPMPYVLPAGLARSSAPAAEAGDGLFDQAMDQFMTLGPLAEPAAVPTAADLATYRAFLSRHEGERVQPYLEQLVASALLLRVLPANGAATYLDTVPAATGPDAVAAAYFAARLLLENENPRADLIAQAVSLSRSEWTDADADAARFRASAAARAWATKPCALCSTADAAPRESVAHRADMLSVANRVERLVRQEAARRS